MFVSTFGRCNVKSVLVSGKLGFYRVLFWLSENELSEYRHFLLLLVLFQLPRREITPLFFNLFPPAVQFSFLKVPLPFMWLIPAHQVGLGFASKSCIRIFSLVVSQPFKTCKSPTSTTLLSPSVLLCFLGVAVAALSHTCDSYAQPGGKETLGFTSTETIKNY